MPSLTSSKDRWWVSYANGSANTVRRTGVTYPNAATISIAYDGTAADALGRPDAIKEASSTLCSYRYLGSGTVIGVKYDAASNVELTYENGGSGGDGGDQYTGLDRFGRLVETIWKNSTVKEQSQYGRNRFGGVTWRRDVEAHNQSVSTEDNFYWYDGLYQVQENQRGDLAGTAPNYTGITNPQKAYEWEYDPTGNWLTTSVTAESDGLVLVGTVADVTSTGLAFGHLIGTPPVAVNDTIEVNGTPFTVTSVTINSPQNPATQDAYYEIEVAESTSGINVDDPITAEGETVLPQQRQHNAANEITYVWPPGSTNPTYDPVGNMTLVPPILGVQSAARTFQWDAWNRLVKVNAGEADEVSYAYDGLFRRTTKTNPSETRHYYYNDQWRAVEERVAGAGVTVDRQYVWGLRDRWDLLRRQRSTGGSSLNETHYCLRDYLDPVAIIGTDGLVKERYAYDAFGNVRFLAPDYGSRSSSDFDWQFLFHGEFQDSDTWLYNYGFRYYSLEIGRWLSRDSVEETRGLFDLYKMTRNNAIFYRDYLGLMPIFDPPPRVGDMEQVPDRVKSTLNLQFAGGFTAAQQSFLHEKFIELTAEMQKVANLLKKELLDPNSPMLECPKCLCYQQLREELFQIYGMFEKMLKFMRNGTLEVELGAAKGNGAQIKGRSDVWWWDPVLLLNANWESNFRENKINAWDTLINEISNVVGAEDTKDARSPAENSDAYHHWMPAPNNAFPFPFSNFLWKCRQNGSTDLTKDPLWSKAANDGK